MDFYINGTLQKLSHGYYELKFERFLLSKKELKDLFSSHNKLINLIGFDKESVKLIHELEKK